MKAGGATLTVEYRVVENGWTEARIAELPAVITVAPTEAEVTELLRDALLEYIRALGGEVAA